jgi:hypothetical protein
MKFPEPLHMRLACPLVPRLKLLREPISDRLRPRPSIQAVQESFVSRLDVGERSQFMLNGGFEIIG